MGRWGRSVLKTNAPLVDLTADSTSSLTSAFGSPQLASTHSSTYDNTQEQTGFMPIRPRLSFAFHSALAAGLRRSTRAPGKIVAACGKTNEKAIRESVKEGGTLVWLRSFDIRLHDHPSFSHASQRRLPTYVVYAWSEDEDRSLGDWAVGGTAAAFWLHHAIASLDASLQRKYGINIAIRHAESTATALLRAVSESGVDEVVTSKSFEPAGRRVEAHVHRALREVGVRFVSLNSRLLHDIDEVRVDMGNWRGHFGTLMPFYAACNSHPVIPNPLPEPAVLLNPCRPLSSDGLDVLGFAGMPLRADGTIVDWGGEILRHWNISEEAALDRLQEFLAPQGGLSRYEKERNLADGSSVARLSPYLRFGMLSSRLMMHELKAAGGKAQSVTFFRRLTWRDLAYWQLMLFPAMQTVPIRAHYTGQDWNQDSQALQRWQQGRTGYPLVDAGMRELWATGWMAQNVRMAAATFLCEFLNIHWKEGEKWFHHCLVDADPAINAMMWQNAGKSGLDQWNFSINPVSSGKSQDPKGHYVRKWLPELKKLPTKFIHEPWTAPPEVLAEAKVNLGVNGNYPERMVVDLKEAARVSSDAIRAVRKRSLEWNDENGYDLILLPPGATKAHDGKRMRVFTVKQFRLTGSGAPVAASPASHSGRGSKGRGSTISATTETRKGKGKGRVNGRQNTNQTVLDEYFSKSS